jgi:kynurenine formamidase
MSDHLPQASDGVETRSTHGRVPLYDELPLEPNVDGRSAWGAFGPDDEFGTLNWTSPQQTLRATGCVRDGETYNLSLPLDYLDAYSGSPDSDGRDRRLRHTIYHRSRTVQDDLLDNLYLQRVTQMDSLRHVSSRDGRFYNGVDAAQAESKSGRLGIDVMARRPLVGRGVLVDIPPVLTTARGSDDPPTAIGVDLIESALGRQQIDLEPGDFMLLRTGYLAWYRSLDDEQRKHEGGLGTSSSGLAASEDVAQYLWDKRVSLVVADNPGLEVMPGTQGQFLHRRLIAGLGMPLGEWFDLDGLVIACERDWRFDCLVAIAVLNLPGGVGSPASAVAVR